MNIENYNMLYIVFLILTFVFLIIDIILFFVFNISKIISVKTGYAKKQSIKEMNQIQQSQEKGTTVLQNFSDEDTVLLNQDEVTAVLSQNNDLQKYVLKAGEFFDVVYSEMVIPSKNII